jgi:hypothetical protein
MDYTATPDSLQDANIYLWGLEEKTRSIYPSYPIGTGNRLLTVNWCFPRVTGLPPILQV